MAFAIKCRYPAPMDAKVEVSTNETDYRHMERYRVRYDDLDTFRHVNNKAFLSYIEDARVRYLRDAAALPLDAETQVSMVIVHASIDYRAQVFPFEEVTVHTRAARIGEKSVALNHLIIAEAMAPDDREAESPERTGAAHRPGRSGRRVAATSTSVLATIDLTTGRSRANLPEMVRAIEAWESQAGAGD